MHHPLRKPGAAWDLEIDDTTIVRSAKLALSKGEANCPLYISCSYTSSLTIHKLFFIQISQWRKSLLRLEPLQWGYGGS